MKRIVLCDVRSAHNVGSIFRTADGAGVERIYLCGYTPQPVDRFGRVQKEILKTSLGATDTVAWEEVEDIIATLGKLKDDGWHIVAVEQTKGAVSLDNFKVPSKVVYIFGNERDGVPKEVLSQADTTLEIPMLGKKESLNVAVAVGVVLFIQGIDKFGYL